VNSAGIRRPPEFTRWRFGLVSIEVSEPRKRAMAATLNLIEGIFWLLLGGLCVAMFVAGKWPSRWVIPLAVLLILFGVSDLIERHTGAWWRPWWLLLWKAVCVIGLLACALMLYRGRAKPEQ
jgi:hypothetical protein